MAKKKDRKRPSQEQARPVRRWTTAINALLLAVLAGIIIWGVQSGLFSPLPAPDLRKPETSAPTPTPTRPTTATPVDDVVTPEQDRFMRESIFADWERIRTSYPILDLRQRFDRLMQRIKTRHIRLQVSALYKPERPTVLAEADRVIMQPIIRFYAPAMMDFYGRTPHRDTRDDIIIGLLLHEEYHLDNHVFAPPQGAHPQIEASMRESDTWWWCCETIYAPMVSQGRLSQLPPHDPINTALRCYNEAQGDKSAPSWLDFCLADPTLQKR